jgi:putative ABC transport system permease protein
MAPISRDLQLGLRTLRKSPGLTLVATVALTFGIGLTTMMFSIIYGALLKGLPFEGGDRIVAVARTNPERGINRAPIALPDFADIAAQQKSFVQFGAWTSGTMNVSGIERAERFSGSWVTRDLFEMAGTPAHIGRAFLPGEDSPSGARVAILGYDTWQTRFGGDAKVLGTTIRVNGQPFEIVGVMPDGFAWPNNDQLWLPLQTDPLVGGRGDAGSSVSVAGKLAPGVTAEQAQAELTTLYTRLGETYPETNSGNAAVVSGFVDFFIGPEPRQLLYTMLGAVFFVLLIACSNVANLLLDRAAHRSKEVGVRAALGASRAAIVRIFLSEAFVLAALGTVLGVIVAKLGVDAFNRAIVDTQPPFFIQIGLHPPVLAFAILIAVLATLFSGLIPAIQASRPDIAEVLKDDSRGASSLKIGKISKALIVFEVALSCGLLVAAGLMIKSVSKTRSMDTGFEMASVFTARVGFPAAYSDTAAQQRFFEQLDERVNGLPGVHAATIASGLPGAQQGLDGEVFSLEGKAYENDRERPNTRVASVTPNFFRTLDIPLRQGRLLEASDRAGNLPVAVVTERFVQQHFADGNALGKRVRLGGGESTQEWITIVGVVPNVFAGDPDEPFPAAIFRPFSQAHSAFAYVAVRAMGDPMSMADPVRQSVASLEPDLPIYWPMTYDAAVAQPLWFIRVFGTMFMVFGVVALFLASIGLYAVMSFSVSRRAREVGIRMALGATARDVIRLLLSQGWIQLGMGLGIGLVLAGLISRVMSVVLFDVEPLDPVVFGGVALTLVATGTLACLLPARRATRVDPSDAMRSE